MRRFRVFWFTWCALSLHEFSVLSQWCFSHIQYHIVLYRSAHVRSEVTTGSSQKIESSGGSTPAPRLVHITRKDESEIMNDYFRERHREDSKMTVIWCYHLSCFSGLSDMSVYFCPCNWYGQFLLLFLSTGIPKFFSLVCFSPVSLSASPSLLSPLTFLSLCYDWTWWVFTIFGRQIFGSWSYLLGTQFIWVHGLTPCFLSGPVMLGQDFLRQPYQLEPQHWNRTTNQDRAENTTVVTKVCLYERYVL